MYHGSTTTNLHDCQPAKTPFFSPNTSSAPNFFAISNRLA